MEDPTALEGSSPFGKLTEFDWPDEIDHRVEQWRNTKAFPFLHMDSLDPSNPDVLTIEDCRLSYHACNIERELESTNTTRFTTLAHEIPEYVLLRDGCLESIH